ncbi:TerD family protein [Kitasatospora sp. NPDC048365]|uniref:TerD family protein n=1 Tax=Kitasatospora sp. NPDC048365 TaxID=3364050 RepID=UPI00371AF9D7
MTIILKGANTLLPAGPFRVTVAREARPGTAAVAAAVAAVAVLVDAAGRVRGEADVVHGGRRAHPSGAVRHLGGGVEGELLVEWVEVDEEAVEADVQRVLIAVVAAGGTSAAVAGLSVEVAGGEGAAVARYEVVDGGGEGALVLGECYRRNGAWRFRAVGQGYAAGPAALAADFGFPVEALPVPGPAVGADPAEPLPGPASDATADRVSSLVKVPGPAVGAEPATAPPRADELFRKTSGEAGPVHAATVQEGRGKQELTVVNPAPGRPAIVEYERLDGPSRHSWFYVWRLDEQGGVTELTAFATTRDARGQLLAFAKGEPEVRLRVEGSGDWRLRVRPIDTAEVLDGYAEGKGQAVLRYAGPPALLRATCDGPEGTTGYVHTVQSDGTGQRVGRFGTGMPTTGPLAVGPEGWCHVVVKLDPVASWRLEVLPLDRVRELREELSGHGWELLEMTGTGTKVRVRLDRRAESDSVVLATLDAYLRPERQLCAKPGVYPVPPGLVAVRTAEKWTLKVRR